MWYVRRNYQHFSGAHDMLLAFYDEFQGALEDVGDLLILVAMHRHDAASPENQPGEHALFARNELSIEQRIEVLHRHVLKSDVLESGRLLHLWCAHIF
ncbi:MAG: hypothetical protein QOJ51_3968 [Acidobacteriaceae bacterium]|nr:hypothetical protein [Acidobacteriaceae bacterium]